MDMHTVIKDIKDKGWIEFYEQGACHILAMALQDSFDDYRYRVFFDPFESLGTDENGSPILSVVHVYALVSKGGQDYALDAAGCRRATDAEADVLARFCYGVVSYEDLTDRGMRDLMDKALLRTPTNAELIAARRHAKKLIAA